MIRYLNDTLNCSKLYVQLKHLVAGAVYRVPGESGETGKWCPGREKIGNNVKITQNRDKTGIILGSVKRGSTPNDETRNTGTVFHVAYLLPKLIGWVSAIPSLMTNEIASYKSAKHYFQRWPQSCSSQLRWWFLETIIIVIIFLKHSWWLTMYREMSKHIFAVSSGR